LLRSIRLLGAFAVASFLLVAADRYTDIRWILPFLTRVLGLYGMRFAVFCAVVGLGFLAHAWKQKNQYTYGFGEVLFACACDRVYCS
jgi:hypothetical protein